MRLIDRSRNAFVIGALGILGSSVAVFGDDPIVIHGVEFSEPPMAMSIETDDGWRFEPAISGEHVVGLLATYAGVGGTPASIRTVWFEPHEDGTWSGWGWQNATQEAAAAWVAWFYQDAEMFSQSGELGELDLALVVPGEAPVELRLGFDIDDPFQPVLEEIGPAGAEILIEIGAAGLPVLAPMALPGGAGGFELACALGEMGQELADASGIITELGDGDEEGCTPSDQTCWPSTTTLHYGPDCSPWSGWSIQQKPDRTPYCRRERDCRTHTRKYTIHSDCSVTWGPHVYGPWKREYGEKPLNSDGDCD